MSELQPTTESSDGVRDDALASLREHVMSYDAMKEPNWRSMQGWRDSARAATGWRADVNADRADGSNPSSILRCVACLHHTALGGITGMPAPHCAEWHACLAICGIADNRADRLIG